MKKLIKLMAFAFVVSSLFAVSAMAETTSTFMPGLDVIETSDKITVTVSDEADNDTILAEEKPSLSIPCTFDKAYVKYGENVIDSTLTEGEITFTVEKSGNYVIIAGEAPDTDDDNDDDDDDDRFGGGHSLENITGKDKNKAEVPVTDYKKEDVIILTIGEKQALVYGIRVTNDVAPVIKNNRTMLPIRFVVEAMGGRVLWFDDMDLVRITRGDIVIDIYIGYGEAYVNGKAVTLDSPAYIENSRTYVPIRFVAENLGAKVEWNTLTRQVVIVP